MTKHVSSGGDATSSPRDAATESLPTRDAADDAAQRLSQGATSGRGSDSIEEAQDVKNAVDTADARVARTEAPAKDVTQDSAKGSGTGRAAAGSSTADTRLGGAWVSPDAQNAATIGVAPSTSPAAKKARTKARGPWYRRRAVVGAAGVALLAGSFGAGWGATSSSVPAPSTIKPSSREAATVGACPQGAREVLAVQEALVVRAGLADRCPAAAPAVKAAREAPVNRTARAVRAVREEAPAEPAGPPLTGTPPVVPARARAATSSRAPARVMAATRRVAQAPRVSSSSRTPLQAPRAESAGATAHRTTFSSKATRIRVVFEVLVGVCRFGYGRRRTSHHSP